MDHCRSWFLGRYKERTTAFLYLCGCRHVMSIALRGHRFTERETKIKYFLQNFNEEATSSPSESSYRNFQILFFGAILALLDPYPWTQLDSDSIGFQIHNTGCWYAVCWLKHKSASFEIEIRSFFVGWDVELKGAQAWEFFARVFCSKGTHLGMWLRAWGKNRFFYQMIPDFVGLWFFAAYWVCRK